MSYFFAIVFALLPCAAYCAQKPLPKVPLTQQAVDEKEARRIEESKEKSCLDKMTLALQNLVEKDGIMADISKQAKKLSLQSAPAQYAALTARIRVQCDDWGAISVDLRDALKLLPASPDEELLIKIRAAREYCDKTRQDSEKLKAVLAKLARASTAGKAPAGTDKNSRESAHRLLAAKDLYGAANTLSHSARQLAAAGKFLSIAGK